MGGELNVRHEMSADEYNEYLVGSIFSRGGALASSGAAPELEAKERRHVVRERQQCYHTARVVATRDFNGEVLYLVRFLDFGDGTPEHFSWSYMLKRYRDFERLHTSLESALRCRHWKAECTEERCVKVLPQLPTNGRFGFRLGMARRGAGHFLDRQRKELDGYMRELLRQVNHVCSDKNLHDFFVADAIARPETDEEQQVLAEMIAEVRRVITWGFLVGSTWRMDDCVLKIESPTSGTVTPLRRGRTEEMAPRESIKLEEFGHYFVLRGGTWILDRDLSTRRQLVWCDLEGNESTATRA